MTTERKILVILGVIILALAVFGFEKQEKYDYSGPPDVGFGQPSNAPAYEYAVTHYGGSSNQPWDGSKGLKGMQDHLNMMGAQGWELVKVQEGGFSDGYTFIFMRPVARWR